MEFNLSFPIQSKEHLERLITRSEGVIQESMAAMAAVEPDLNQARMMYEELLQKYKESENIKTDEEKMLDVLVRHRNGYKSKGEIRLIRTTTHLKKKCKVDENGKPLQIAWSAMAKEVLNESNRFMSGDDIYDTIVHRNESMQGWDRRTSQKYRWSVTSVILKGKQFISYNNKFGLPEWVDHNKRPYPKFLAQFMQAS